MSLVAQKIEWRASLGQLRDRRFLPVLYFGFLSGFPWVLIGSALSLWLKEVGASRSTIGYFFAVGTVYALNFFWAPLVDRVRLPGLARLGQRRSWLVVLLTVMGVFTYAMGHVDPAATLYLTALLVLGIAITSATQDLVIDAYRIERFPADQPEKLSLAAACATAGWWAGFGFLGGVLALWLGGETIGLPWSTVYQLLGGFLWLQVAIVLLFVDEPASQRQQITNTLEADYRQRGHSVLASRFMVAVVEPVGEFFRRCGWQLAVALILFALTFKLGEAFLGRMSIVFYKEIGFSTDQITAYSKFGGGIATALFAFGGALINTHFGVIRGLFIGGIAMAASNLLFALIAQVGPNETLLAGAIFIDSFTGAFGTVAFIAFISYFTNRTFTATQYALMASIGNLGRTTLAASSGKLVDMLDGNWALFFILTAVAVIPPLLLLLWIERRLKTYDRGDI